MTGVRAEPKYLRDPTSFETLSSGLSRLSSYVTSNLPKRKPTFPPYLPAQDPQLLFYQQQLLQQQQRSTAAINNNNTATATDNNNNNNRDEEIDSTETITFASFEKFESHLGKIACLLLGYEQGFQLWNVSQPDNVHEIASIRLDNIGTVIKLHVISTPTISNLKHDQFKEKRPLLAIITNNPNHQEGKTPHETDNSIQDTTNSSKTITSSFHLYSLKTHEFIPFDLNLPDDTILTDVKSNGKVVVLGCKNQNHSSLQLLSSHDLSPSYATLTDVSHQPDGPVFTLGSRLLAYATTLQVLNNDSNNTNTDKDVKETAKDIAKEMVNGVKSLGEFGYNRLSNYFLQNNQDGMTSMNHPNNSNNMNHPIVSSSTSSTPSPYFNPAMMNTSLNENINNNNTISSNANNLSSSSSIQKQSPTGMVVIRDINKLPTSSKNTNQLSLSTVAHFKPHSHSIAILSFNIAGNLLMSVSKQGHTFHIFTMYPTDRHLANAAHLYNLSRGYTDARVVDCQFSIDSTWCAVTTARGTTHMYTINPYGGKPEINAHVNGKINNLVNSPFSTKKNPYVTSLGPAVRVKQRRPLTTDPTTSIENQGLETGSMPSNGLYSSSTITSSSSSPPLYYHPQKWQTSSSSSSTMTTNNTNTKKHRANLTTMFLSVTHVPDTLQGNNTNNNSNSNNNSHHSSPQPSNIPNSGQLSKVTSSSLPPPATLTSIKNQASTLVSQVSSYLPHAQRDWTWAKDKSNDNRMFGFDEEESSLDDDTATKMINDSTGYQDVYSLHPTGILTLHRLWVTKTMVKKRVQGRMVGKWDLSVREEDIAEWQIARNSDWEEVKIPIHMPSSYLNKCLWNDNDDDDNDDQEKNNIFNEKNILSDIQDTEILSDSSSNNNNISSNSNKKKKKQNNNKNKNIDQTQPTTTISSSSTTSNSSSSTSSSNDNHSQQQQQQQGTNHWLSHAEIMTYANNSMTNQDPPLWLNPQFNFQLYTDPNKKNESNSSSKAHSTISSMLLSGIVPPTTPLVVRSDTPEPYTSRINRIGKTNAVARSLDNEEFMDDALAELEENLSTAMQTSFVPSSNTASPRHSSMKLSSSAGTQSSPQMKKRTDQTSSLSFENAYLISMGGIPVYRGTSSNNYQKQNDEEDIDEHQHHGIYQPTITSITSSMQNSSLIQFDSDNDIDINNKNDISHSINVNNNNNNNLNHSISKISIEDQRSDDNVNIASSSSLLGSYGIQGLDDDSIRLDDKDFGDVVFSPDGDNEIEYPSDSVVFGRE